MYFFLKANNETSILGLTMLKCKNVQFTAKAKSIEKKYTVQIKGDLFSEGKSEEKLRLHQNERLKTQSFSQKKTTPPQKKRAD